MAVFDIIGVLTKPFAAAAGWAWDTVIGGISDWIAKGVLALLMALWNFMDTASSPDPKAEWFSGNRAPVVDGGTPFDTAFGIGVAVVAVLVLLAVIKAVVGGSPRAVVQTVGRDLPLAAFAAFSVVGFSKLAIDVADGISDYVWLQSRDSAESAMGNIMDLMMVSGSSTLAFAGPLLGLFLLIAMLFMWIVLFVRESLIYLVIIYAVAFGFPSMLFPPLRDTSKKVLELLVALIIAKPVMVLAMAVSVSALDGIGATGQRGEGVGDNLAAELGTLVSGIVLFMLAAFMPYLTWKLMPVVVAATVAQGIASAPMRGAMQSAQLSYYGGQTMKRLSGKATGGARSGGGAAGSGAGGAANGASSLAGGSAGGGALAGGGAAGGGAAVGGGAAAGGASAAAAAPAAGPAAPLVVAAAAVNSTAQAVKSTAQSTTSSVSDVSGGGSSGSAPPRSGSGRDVSGGS
jgi:type IV secretion system protein TrbL